MEAPKPHSPFVRNFYFWCGILATVAYRIIVALNGYGPTAVSVAWYVGTVGFVLYFIHRYEISEIRAKLIKQNNLLEKVDQNAGIDQTDKDALRYILTTLSSSREKINYIFIFVASALALLWGVYVDFIAK